jgi:hypothetical protein
MSRGTFDVLSGEKLRHGLVGAVAVVAVVAIVIVIVAIVIRLGSFIETS